MHTLYVVATPIGNLEDVSIRAIKILLTTPVIACEDTRRTGQLIKLLIDRWAQRIGLNPLRSRQFVSVRDWNEAKMVSLLVGYLVDGDVALVSDAGTPLISDPGFKIVRAARQAGCKVSPIPGPNAAMAALSASGLPTDKFVFWGFLPKKWELYPNLTNIIYESPHRVQKTVSEIQSKYPGAEIVVASELTKIHELITENWQLGTTPPKGEFVILVNFSPSSKLGAEGP